MSGYRDGESIQEIRGMPPVPRERTEPYSPESYAAQYGITVEDARGFVASSNTHQQVERQVFALYKQRPEVKARALFRTPEPELTDEEKKRLGAGGASEIIKRIEGAKEAS